MNTRESSMYKTYENEFSEFLAKRIYQAGGSLQLQHITGHLSQVRPEVKNAIVNTKADLIKFLKKHDHLFSIDDNVVRLKSSVPSTSGYESDVSSTKSYSSLPPKIKKGKGVIVKLFPGYGFIKSKEPIKTDIFFNSLCFGDKDIDLTSFLYVGAIVFFSAKQESSKFSCKYHAVRVWRDGKGDDESNVIVQKSRKNRDTGLYDPLNLESEGVIQNVFPNLGFISVKGDDNNTVFFHKNRVVNYDNIVDLTKVFSKGDRVEFAAHRSSKPDAKARWEATKVWKISGKIQESIAQSEKNQLSLPNTSVPILRTKVPEMIKNQAGKLYPRSHGAVVKFGINEIADGDSAIYYVCGTQVTEIGWEFSEGDDVYFDAVKIKSAPGWKAVLVWTGKKPDIVLPTCVGDFSEFTEDDNTGNCSSVYTSKSSLSENSSSSLKSEKFSKTEDFKKDNTRNKESKSINKKLSKNKTSSRESLNSRSLSDKHYYAGKEAKSSNKLSRNYSRGSLNSLTLSDKYDFASKDIEDTDNLSINYNASSRDSLNLTPSDNRSFKSSECTIKSSNKSIDQLNKKRSNWDDVSNPVDEAYESMEVSKSLKDILSKCDSEVKSFTRVKEEDSSEYGSDEEVNSSEIKDCKTLSQNISSKSTASIKRFKSVKGEISKVYSRFAEVKSSHLQYAVSFSLNDFYLNEMPIDEHGIDDLKTIFKIGDKVYFNCFVVIDDSGQNWQKITLAWKGSKPRHAEEISPEDFIKENDLSVTVLSEISDDEIDNKGTHRKFLTSFVDEIPDATTDNVTNTESYLEKELLSSSLKPIASNKMELPVESESLSDVIYKLLKKSVFSEDSMVDIKSVSEEIINVVLENYTKKDSTCNVLPETKCTNESLGNICSKCKENNLSLSSSSKTKNTAVQTIITGDIISQHIIPDG